MIAIKDLENEIEKGKLINHEFIVRNKDLLKENNDLKERIAMLERFAKVALRQDIKEWVKDYGRLLLEGEE